MSGILWADLFFQLRIFKKKTTKKKRREKARESKVDVNRNSSIGEKKRRDYEWNFDLLQEIRVTFFHSETFATFFRRQMSR